MSGYIEGVSKLWIYRPIQKFRLSMEDGRAAEASYPASIGLNDAKDFRELLKMVDKQIERRIRELEPKP